MSTPFADGIESAISLRSQRRRNVRTCVRAAPQKHVLTGVGPTQQECHLALEVRSVSGTSGSNGGTRVSRRIADSINDSVTLESN